LADDSRQRSRLATLAFWIIIVLIVLVVVGVILGSTVGPK
jgi:predicted nucleic acid-binding Zn ribbon protein